MPRDTNSCTTASLMQQSVRGAPATSREPTATRTAAALQSQRAQQAPRPRLLRPLRGLPRLVRPLRPTPLGSAVAVAAAEMPRPAVVVAVAAETVRAMAAVVVVAGEMPRLAVAAAETPQLAVAVVLAVLRARVAE